MVIQAILLYFMLLPPMWSHLINLRQNTLLYLCYRWKNKTREVKLSLPQGHTACKWQNLLAIESVFSDSQAFASNSICNNKNWFTLSKDSSKVSLRVWWFGFISIKEYGWLKIQNTFPRGEYSMMKCIHAEAMLQETHRRASPWSFRVSCDRLWWTVCKYKINECVIGGETCSAPQALETKCLLWLEGGS